jgi:hypothetical protein
MTDTFCVGQCTSDSPFGPSATDIINAHSRGRNLLPGEIASFTRRGVTTKWLSSPCPVLAAEIVFLPNGYFEFADDCQDGTPEFAFIVIADSYCGANDIVAWQPKTKRTALWLNRAIALGEEQVWGPRFDDAALPIWRTPLKWLAAGRRGLVILRPGHACHLLGNVPAIVAEDVEHGNELELLLTPPKPTTQILVPARTKSINSEKTDVCEAA